MSNNMQLMSNVRAHVSCMKPLGHAIVVFSLALVAGCSSSAGEFSVALGKRLQVERQPVVDLAKVTSLNWEELFIFGPYSIREESCKLLQLSWLECRFTIPSSVDEGEYFLVFRAKQKVVHSERHARGNGDFHSRGGRRPQPVSHLSAKFNVVPTGSATPQGAQWFRLEYANP